MKKNDNEVLNTEENSSSCACSESAEKNSFDPERRNALKYFAMAVPAVTGVIATSSFAGVDDEKAQRQMPPQIGDRLTFFSKSKRGQVLTLADLQKMDKQVLVLPMDPVTGIVRDKSRYNQILMKSFAPEELTKETAAISAEGVVAYSAICTHNGCPVTGWVKEEGQYMCPCHQSVYDPKNSAAVVSGPAPRALPALPLNIEDGEITVAAEFTSKVGFGRLGG